MDNDVTLLIKGGEIKPLITLPASSTVGELKRKIKEEIGVPVERQRLVHGSSVLSDNNIPINLYIRGAIAEVYLLVRLGPKEARMINVTISNDNFRVQLSVSMVNRVVEVKKKLGEVIGIGIEGIDLWHMFKKMEDDKMLYKYYVDEGSDVRFTRAGYGS